MKQLRNLDIGHSRILMVILVALVIGLPETTPPVSGMPPSGIPLQVEILNPYAIPPTGLVHDEYGDCYEDDSITGSPDVSAYTSTGSGLKMYIYENRSALVDFSHGSNGGPSLCSMGDVPGPIEDYYQPGGGCYVRWPTLGTSSIEMGISGMFSGKFKPGQTMVTDAYFKLHKGGWPMGYYTFNYVDPIQVTYDTDGIRRVARSTGTSRGTLWYWDQSMNKAKKIGDFDIPLLIRGVACPDAQCPGPCPP